MKYSYFFVPLLEVIVTGKQCSSVVSRNWNKFHMPEFLKIYYFKKKELQSTTLACIRQANVWLEKHSFLLAGDFQPEQRGTVDG